MALTFGKKHVIFLKVTFKLWILEEIDSNFPLKDILF